MSRTSPWHWFAFTICCLSSAVAVDAGEPPPPNYAGQVKTAYCASDWPNYFEPKIFFSAVFEFRVPQTAGTSYPQDLGKIFGAYLEREYGYVNPHGNPTMCALMDNRQMAQGSKDHIIKHTRFASTRAGRTEDPVVETGWTLSTHEAATAGKAAATAPAGPPAAVAAANATMTMHGFCWTATSPNYHSAVFNSVMPSSSNVQDALQRASGVWRQAYGPFVIKSHPKFIGIVQCGAFKSLDEAEAYHAKMDGAAGAGGAGTVVETGWSYQAPAS